MEKNTTPERSEGCGDFFPTNPQGTGLEILARRYRNLLAKKPVEKMEGVKGRYQVAAKMPAVWAMRQRGPKHQVF